MHKKFKIWFEAIKQLAKQMKIEIGALYIAFKRSDVPFYAKLVSILVVGYALSPIDLIPDFIPVLGYLDDLILLPLGIALAIKLIPPDIMSECRLLSENTLNKKLPKNWIAASIIIILWIMLLYFILIKFF